MPNSINKPRVKVPKTAKKGEVIIIRTMVRHVMESGHRTDRATGDKVPRMIINRFSATFNGKPLISAVIEPAVSANPYLQFTAKIEESGTFDFIWVDDEGVEYRTSRSITVEG
ncbi:MAG: thiosulfate oxidation carrier complex protein SoxZ [Hyphomicrobiaceae bacterium]